MEPSETPPSPPATSIEGDGIATIPQSPILRPVNPHSQSPRALPFARNSPAALASMANIQAVLGDPDYKMTADERKAVMEFVCAPDPAAIDARTGLPKGGLPLGAT